MDLSPYRVGGRAELMVRRVRLARSAVSFGLIATLSACANQHRAVIVPGTVAVTSSVATQPTSTPVLATSAVAATSSIASTATTTSPVATSTSVAAPSLQAQVATGFEASRRAYQAALADPAHFDPAAIDDTYAAGAMRDEVIGNITKFAAAGWQSKPGPLGLEYAVVEEVAVADGATATTATILVCDVSDSIVFDPANGAIVNNLLESRRIRWGMVLDSGVWKRQSLVEKVLDETGVNRCPPPA